MYSEKWTTGANCNMFMNDNHFINCNPMNYRLSNMTGGNVSERVEGNHVHPCMDLMQHLPHGNIVTSGAPGDLPFHFKDNYDGHCTTVFRDDCLQDLLHEEMDTPTQD